jgi:hypothetical protein
MIRTATTTTDWRAIIIDIDESKHDEYFALKDTLDFEPALQQGLNEGWIVYVGENDRG